MQVDLTLHLEWGNTVDLLGGVGGHHYLILLITSFLIVLYNILIVHLG